MANDADYQDFAWIQVRKLREELGIGEKGYLPDGKGEIEPIGLHRVYMFLGRGKTDVAQSIFGMLPQDLYPFQISRILDDFVRSIGEPMEKLSARVEMKLTVMNPEELPKFLTMEQESWKGNM